MEIHSANLFATTMISQAPETLLDKFIELSTSARSSSWHVIECGEDALTYGELYWIACGISEEISQKYGPGSPTIAIVSENHPFFLAVILATWLLGGIVAPLDHHAPEILLRGMLERVEPTCVVLPASHAANLSTVRDMGIPAYCFNEKECTIPQLKKRFASDLRVDVGGSRVPRPERNEDAIYIFTSSAFSVSTLKCVPLSHHTIYTNCAAQLSWLQSTFPSTSFDRLRVLGWGPWTHIMGISHDIGAHCFLTGGCYIFGILPSFYLGQSPSPAPPDVDLGYLLLDTASRCGATAFAGVPWVIRTFMETEKALGARGDKGDSRRIIQALRSFKIMISGGAKTDVEVERWSKATGLNLILGIGMTELGGPIFHTRLDSLETQGWPLSDFLIPDAKISLMDESGLENAQEGELCVRSKLISRGYRRFDTNTFSTDESGVITFRTGDIYAFEGNHIVWKGRREDYIQLLSGEILDPRIPESQLDAENSIARSCLVGNNWAGASKSICAIIELEPSQLPFTPDTLIRALGSVNKGLAPPLRVAWSRVLVLEQGEKIPITRKGVIWRKALEQHFGVRLSALLADPGLSRLNEVVLPRWTVPEVESSITEIVSDVLEIRRALLGQHSQSTFAELGMDSQMAIRIVGALNEHFKLQLPLNTCHDHVDLSQLSRAVCQKLRLSVTPLFCPPASTFTSPPQSVLDDNDVVIVGQALRLPGGLDTVDAFWEALTTQREDLLGSVPQDRWDHASYYDPTGKGPATINFDRAGFINVASYDNAFFGISSAEAYFITPAARLALEVSVEALENANIPPSSVKGTNMGVFVATAPDDGYVQLMWVDRGYDAYTRYHGSGIAASTVCGRLSYFLDIHGPSISLDTACSAGMVALDSAVQHIKRGDGEAAIVCAANSHLWPGVFAFLSANQMTSPHGRCATFSADADGYAPSEGVVSLVLKSKAAAIRDRNEILAVIKATAVQHNGRSQGLIAPSSKAQANLQRTLLSKARLRPHDIDLLETHGTGTILGDIIEIEAINDVFTGSHSVDMPLVLGASKTVVGHTEASAGLVGLLATMMSLRTGIVPGLAHLREDNFNLNLDITACPVSISQSNTLLPKRAGSTEVLPLRGLNLAYGFAGTISGAVVEEHSIDLSPTVPDNTAGLISGFPNQHLFVLSAKTPKALAEYIRRYMEFCRGSREEDLPNICYTSCIGREHYRYRLAFVVKTMPELIKRLQVTLSDFDIHPPQPTHPRPLLIFAYPGQGTQYQGMARYLCRQSIAFDTLLRRGASEANRFLDFDILPFLIEESSDSSDTINETHIAQVCIYVFQCAMAQWLQKAGIHPQGVLPHSLGEIAASVAAGVMSFRTGLEFIMTRSDAMRPEPTRPGAMAAINSSSDAIMDAIRLSNVQEHVSIAAFNSNNSHTISGDEWAVDEINRVLSTKVRCRKLMVNQGFHSHCVDRSLSPIRQWLESQTSALLSPTIPFYSTVIGGRLNTGEKMGVKYWVKQARSPIRFAAAAEAATRDGATVLIDLGPQPVIAGLLPDIPACHLVTAVSLSTRQGERSEERLLTAIGELFVHGVTPDFLNLFEGSPAEWSRKLLLPTYPWQRQRFFPKIIPTKHPSDRKAQMSVSAAWDIDDDLMSLLADHSSSSLPVVPTAAMVLIAVQTVEELHPPGTTEINIRMLKPMILDGTPGDQLTIEPTGTDSGYRISHCPNSAPADIVCTCTIRRHEHSMSQKAANLLSLPRTENILSKTEIYSHLGGGRITFGAKFQNLKEIRCWAQHADGTIELEPVGVPRLDLIRQLDSCLHMFGALHVPSAPGARNGPGSFLPHALVGFKLYAKSFPHTFTCRYILPIKIEKNFTRMTTSFEVLSQSGDILASCDSYSVAWIPSNISFSPKKGWSTPRIKPSLMRTVWEHAHGLDTVSNSQTSYRVVYIGSRTLFSETLKSKARACGHSFLVSEKLPEPCNLPDVVLYDARVSKDKGLCVKDVMAYSSRALQFMQAISTGLRSRNIASIVFLTQNAFILSGETVEALALAPHHVSDTTLEMAGSMVQGMLRVLRHETGVNSLWGLDLPSIPPDEMASLVFEEIHGLERTTRSPIAYRYNSEGDMLRFAPSLRRDEVTEVDQTRLQILGSVAIVGMGDIAKAMIESLVQAGSSCVVFISRKPEHDPEVLSTLERLRESHPKARFEYYSADITSYTSLRDALKSASSVGPIQTVVHTASVVKDSLIPRTTLSAFQEVAAPKVAGSINLHLACKELNLNIRRFIVLSSISVPLGNPGQIAYVAANSFLDALVSHLNLISPATRYVSLQLGAWQSRLTHSMRFDDDEPMMPISHTEGLPLLFRAVEGTRSVQILSKLRPERMRRIAEYAEDPYYEKFLQVDTTAEKQVPAVVRTEEEVEVFLKTKLKHLLEMGSDEYFDIYTSLASLGVDSIAFTQLRGMLLKRFSVNIPMSLLGEDCVVMDIVGYIMRQDTTRV